MSDFYQADEQQVSIFEAEGPNLIPASNGQRFAHYIIDMIVAYGITLAFFAVFAIVIPGFADWAVSLDDDIGGKLLDRLMTAAALGLVFTLIEGATKGLTRGKLITGSRAVREDGSPITWKDAFIWSFSRLIPFEPFSIFGSQIWHDRLSNTTVISKR